MADQVQVTKAIAIAVPGALAEAQVPKAFVSTVLGQPRLEVFKVVASTTPGATDNVQVQKAFAAVILSPIPPVLVTKLLGAAVVALPYKLLTGVLQNPTGAEVESVGGTQVPFWEKRFDFFPGPSLMGPPDRGDEKSLYRLFIYYEAQGAATFRVEWLTRRGQAGSQDFNVPALADA